MLKVKPSKIYSNPFYNQNKASEGYRYNITEMNFLASTNAPASTSSIFSLDHLDEFLQLSPLQSIGQQEDVTLSSLLQESEGGGGGGGDLVVIPSPRQRPRQGSATSETCRSRNDAAAASDNRTNRKVIHRDIERLRRQEMASLYSSLRLSLPLELLKGKRSISDHIHQAVNYITHQQKKIQGLSKKRDELKRRTESIADHHDSGELSEQACCDPRDAVTINPCMEGVEIIINTSWRQGIPLSRILKVLMRGGLDVVRAISAQVNERVVHSIHAEVEDRGNINLAELHQKLMNLRA